MTQQQKASGLAITSLVLGILSIFCGGPILGVPGLICGLMAMSKASKGEAGGHGIAMAGTVTSGIGIVSIIFIAILAGMLLPVLSKAREKARRANCAGNLKQMGVACLMYSGDYSGYFPTDFNILDSEGYLNASSVYLCPSNSDYTAAQPLPSEGDYLYFGRGIMDDNAQASNVVLICDNPQNHQNEWMNVLFIDGHVEGAKAGKLEDVAESNGWIIPGVNDPVQE